MLNRAVDSGVPPRSSTVPVSIQVQCKYGGVVWFVEELGRFDQAFFIWGIIQGAVNVNWLSRFWTRTTTRPYLFKLNQTLQYQRMQRYFYPLTNIICGKESLLRIYLTIFTHTLRKREERRSQKEKLFPPPGWGPSGHRASKWLGQRWERLKHELGFFYETICRFFFFYYFMI